MKDETRRLKRVEITPEALVSFMKAGGHDVIANALPKDARLVNAGVTGCGFDHVKNLIVLLVESETYEPSPTGKVIPPAPMTVFRNSAPTAGRYTRSEAQMRAARRGRGRSGEGEPG